MKVNLKKIPVLFIFMLPLFIFSQNDFYSGKIRIIVKDHLIIPKNELVSTDSSFSKILERFEITNISQPMFFAKTPELQKLYELETPYSEDSLFIALESLNKEKSLFLSVEKCQIPKPLTNPIDYMWWLTVNDPNNDCLWPLQKIQAPEAWNITKGDTSVKIAVLDSGVDPEHPDLIGKIYPPYNFYSGTPFVAQNHGTSVATILAAETTDEGGVANGQMASIGYNTRIMFNTWGLDACLYASTILGCDILSISWYLGCTPILSYLLVEKEILDNGTTIIKAAGNGPTDCEGNVLYPFSGREDPRVIVVSSTGKNDMHTNTELCSEQNTNSHYPEVDLCAPGYRIMAGVSTNEGLNEWPYYGCWGGTSQSTPFVSGTAALMYAVNPCLTPEWTQNILKNTTDTIYDSFLYPGMVGTGRLNAYKAVLAAQNSHSSSLDLFVRDRIEDFGYLGSYQWGWWFDNSPDIWVRNQPDGFENQIHQDPEYNPSSPVYVYVKVHNKSCENSNSQGNLSLYWSKASTCSSWPENWNGNQPEIGSLIGTKEIPAIAPGESVVLEFRWDISSEAVDQNWAVCLLARIENLPIDPIIDYPGHLEYDVYYNNNIALKNLTIIDVDAQSQLPEINNLKYPYGRFLYIGNAHEHVNVFDITFEASSRDSSSIVDDGEVHIFFDDKGWDFLSEYIVKNPNIKIINDGEIVLRSSSVKIENVTFPAEYRVPIYVGFAFKSKVADIECSYDFIVYQNYSNDTNHIVGAEHFVIHKSARNIFYANAGVDKIITKESSATLVAADINESATYNWYDKSGDLISSSRTIEVSPTNTSDYCLEVISNTDGYKDYDDVVVYVKECWLGNIYPNPANSNVEINYYLGSNDASLSIVSPLGAVLFTQSLNPNISSTIINVSNYPAGIYSLKLKVEGVEVDEKILVIY